MQALIFKESRIPKNFSNMNITHAKYIEFHGLYSLAFYLCS